jgi:hypothetical protein
VAWFCKRKGIAWGEAAPQLQSALGRSAKVGSKWCVHCREDLVDSLLAQPARAHLCSACGKQNDTPASCLLHPLGRLLPTWAGGELGFSEAELGKVHVPLPFPGQGEFEEGVKRIRYSK